MEFLVCGVISAYRSIKLDQSRQVQAEAAIIQVKQRIVDITFILIPSKWLMRICLLSPGGQ